MWWPKFIEITFVAFTGSFTVKLTKDFDEADYDYALNNYNKMLEAIAEADIKVNSYLEKNEVSEHIITQVRYFLKHVPWRLWIVVMEDGTWNNKLMFYSNLKVKLW